VRYRADGTPDPKFATAGVLFLGPDSGYSTIRESAVDLAGRVVAAGSFTADPFNSDDDKIVRLTRLGRLDKAFGVAGQAPVDPSADLGDRIQNMVVTPRGRVIAQIRTETGTRPGTDPLIAEFRPDGSLDPHGGVPIPTRIDGVADMSLQQDGRLVIVGSNIADDGTATSSVILRMLRR
jgi:hypothetical protein